MQKSWTVWRFTATFNAILDGKMHIYSISFSKYRMCLDTVNIPSFTRAFV